MVATRTRRDAAFSAPQAIESITGFVEAPSVAPDGVLYFHEKVRDHHRIARAPRRRPH